MHRFFIKKDQIDRDEILICGGDVNHIKNVLRMKKGDRVFLSCENDLEYECSLEAFSEDRKEVRAWFQARYIHGMETELKTELVLYQGLPKGDKMEWIIQKAVELGVSRIVPVRMKRCVVKLDDKKAEKKVKRWNAIALSAAKQARRGRIPQVSDIVSYDAAVQEASDLDMLLVPYEEARGMEESRKLLREGRGKKSIGIMIGPEGGFDEEEVARAREAGGRIMTLGKRILRTETAGMAVLSILMFLLEE